MNVYIYVFPKVWKFSAVLEFSRIAEPIEYIKRDIKKKDLLQELAHILTETEKSHDMSSVSRRARKSGGIIQYMRIQS